MNLIPNMLLVNVEDVPKAQQFYESLFDIEAAFSMQTFAAYPIGGGVQLALQKDWSAPPNGFRPNSELVVNIRATPSEMDALYKTWLEKGAKEIDSPHLAPFGYTFVVADPYGNLIRVAPEDA